MSDEAPTFAGWYPDPSTGGTRYSDGTRWTGDKRPKRRAFAAAAAYPTEGWSAVGLGVCFAVISFGALGETGSSGYLFSGLGLPAVGLGAGIYMLRGQGPTTEAVEKRLAEEKKTARGKRAVANVAGVAAGIGRILQPRPTPTPAAGSVEAAQVRALANPDTARALQNLENLLFTRTITDEEFRRAKNKLFVSPPPAPDAFEQIDKLVELHRVGILGDVEFSAAKAKALGI